MSTQLNWVAMMGGTFDPIHHGHLRTAVELRDRLHLDQLRLIPCHRPPHRDRPATPSQHRMAMVQLAIDGEPRLQVDDRELRSDRPSYSIDTLTSLRQELGEECSLAMVIGTDALLGLASWHHWHALTEVAHIVVVKRPGWQLRPDHPLYDWVAERQVASPEALRQQPHGLLLWQQLTPLAISATQIREELENGGSARYLTPDSVLGYMAENQLYRHTQI